MSFLSGQIAALALWGFVSEGGMGHAMHKNYRGAVVWCIGEMFRE